MREKLPAMHREHQRMGESEAQSLFIKVTFHPPENVTTGNCTIARDLDEMKPFVVSIEADLFTFMFSQFHRMCKHCQITVFTTTEFIRFVLFLSR